MNDYRGFLPAVYNRMTSMLATIERHLGQFLPTGLDFGREVLTRRLLQEIHFLWDTPIRRIDGERALQGRPPLQEDRPVFRCGGLVVNPVTGAVRTDARHFFWCLGGFLVLWLAGVWYALIGLLRGGREKGGSIVFGVPEEGLFRGDDATFAEFTRAGPVTPLNGARRLYVQALTRNAVSTDPRIRYARYPVFDLLASSPMSAVEFLRFGAQHAGVALRFVMTALRFPLFAILWRDFGLYALIASLNRRRLVDAMFMTSSNWSRQLLCMADLPGRHYETHFIFYSQHDRPPAYVDIEERCAAFPNMRLLRAEHYWLWTPGHADMLSRGGVRGQMHVVGPILWEVLRRERIRLEDAWISVFDITPLSPQANRDYGRLGNYYSTENLLAFLDGIESAARAAGTLLPLVIKAKRAPTALNDPNYQSRIEKSGLFRQFPPSASAYDVVAKSAAVIVYPFSTVAYIADWLGKPVIYFDPTGRLAPTHEPGRCIRFASSVQELAGELQAVMAEACPAS